MCLKNTHFNNKKKFSSILYFVKLNRGNICLSFL